MAFWKSQPERMDRYSNLRPGQQEDLWTQYQNSLQGSGAGGSFGDLSDYYRGLMSGEGADAYEKPMMRQFQEDIMPGIAEQFAGMGSGGLSSGGFMQETGRAATDLSERIGQMRADLRMQGAQGMQQMQQGAFNPVDQQVFRPREAGFGEKLVTEFAGGVGKAAGTYLGGVTGGAAKAFGSFLEK